MRKIALVVESFSTGIFQLLVEITAALHGEFDFTIVHGIRPETPENFKAFFPPNVDFIHWSAQREISPGKDLGAYRELMDILRQRQPDLVHAHSSKAGALARPACARLGIPVLYTPHSYSFLRQDVSAAKRLVFRLIEWGLGTLPHLTIASGLSEFREALSVTRRVHMVRNGLPLPEASFPDPMGRKPLRIVNSGGIRPQKNFPLFCAVAARPEHSAMSFVWIGGGDTGNVRIPPNVEITGWLPHAEVGRIVSAADVFMMTSLWEGLCIAMLEAMGLGKPVLSSTYRGAEEAVIEGTNGFLCADEAEFSVRLRELDRDRQRLSAMGRMARETVEREFSPELFVARWRSIYANPKAYGLASSRQAVRSPGAGGSLSKVRLPSDIPE